jgi:riboflavin kinase/FMN adenylyltransferase
LPDGVFYALARVNDKYIPSLLIKGFISGGAEIYIIDWSGDLYGKELEVEILEKLRNIIRFDKVDELIEQIQKDIAEAKSYFKDKI